MHENRIVDLVQLIATRIVTEGSCLQEMGMKKDEIIEDDEAKD